jgi:hypothetical protein
MSLVYTEVSFPISWAAIMGEPVNGELCNVEYAIPLSGRDNL